MTNLKHVGRMITSRRKIVLAYKVVPGEPENAIVVTTENLSADEHDSLMKLVESPSGQEADDLAEAMARVRLPDGRNMLASFHHTGKLIKVATSDVELTPNRNTSIKLSELNELIAQQRGISIEDLAGVNTQNTDTTESTNNDVVASTQEGVLTDEELAAKYRSDADRLYKEAKRLRDEAEKLSPTKRKTSSKKQESV